METFIISLLDNNLLMFIALLVAIIVPMIKGLIDKKYSQKVNKRSSIQSIFYQYIGYASKVLCKLPFHSEFTQAHYLAYLHAPDEIKPTMDEFLNNVEKDLELSPYSNKELSDKLREELTAITKAMSNVINNE